MSRWVEVPLGSAATLQRGFDLPKRLRRPGKVPIVSSSGVNDWHDQPQVSGPGVVTGRYGTIGKVYYREEDFWPLNTTLWVSDFHGNDERFIYYLLQTIDLLAHSGKSGVPGVNRNDLHAEVVGLPLSVKEQRAIVEALDDAGRLVGILERTISKKVALRHGMRQQLLTGRTRLPGFSEDWQEATLGDHVTYVSTVALSRAQLDSESSVRYLHYGDIHTRTDVRLDAVFEVMPRASSKLLRNAGQLKVGDLVFADASEDPDGVGKSVEVVSVPDTGLVAGLHTIAARFDKHVLADGFKAYLQFVPSFRDQLLRLAAGTKVLATTRSSISGISLLLPDVEEQNAIANVLSDADAEIVKLQSRLAKARNIQHGMMQELLSGRTRLSTEVTA